MARFDLETLVSKIDTAVKANFTARVAELNLEKGNAPVLEDLPAQAWLFGSLNDAVKNFKNFVYYYVDDIQTKTAGPRYTQDITLEFDFFLFDRQDNLIEKWIMRYQRVLIDAIMDTWNKVGQGYGKATVASLAPIDVKLNNSSHYHKLFGVTLNFTLSF